jgi:nucleoside-diphosphate-sugar epimerase
VSANLLAMKAEQRLGGAVYNVGIGQRISLLDLVASINRLTGRELEPIFQPERAGDVRDSLADLRRISAELGYRPTVDFEAGLERTLEWFQR